MADAVVAFVQSWRQRREEEEAAALVDAGADSVLGVLVFGSDAHWWIPPHDGRSESFAGEALDTPDWFVPNAQMDDDPEACLRLFEQLGLPFPGWNAHPDRPDLCAVDALGSRAAPMVAKATDALLANGRGRSDALVVVASGPLFETGPLFELAEKGVSLHQVAYLEPATCSGLVRDGSLRFAADEIELASALGEVEADIASVGR